MVALPSVCFVLRSVGPAAHVVFYDYLPLVELAGYSFAALLGAALGVDAYRWLQLAAGRAGPVPVPRIRLAALALLVLWVALAQLRAFPATASLAERDVWARDHVRHYAALRRIVAAVPEVQNDIGRIVAIAPTAKDEHVFAREMNGDDMRFTLDVVGERGTGTFYADCTLDDHRVYDWLPARWTFRGRTVRIDRAPGRLAP
jgi:hypothetical protein